ncbi:MAG: transcription termination/antitermination protein NusA [Caldilineaceae bacterium]|nr:transcription termination/antitermination protein NusA [Caldilineaceae bacterium]
MSKALIAGINQVAIDKGLDREVIFEAIEAALISAYKRNYGSVANVSAEVDRVTGEMRVFAEREVVDDVINLRTEITLQDAHKTVPTAELGDVIKVETKPDNFGRIAAQTAKQVILQRIREAERDTVYENFAHRTGELLNAQVRSVDSVSGAVTLMLDEKHECLLLREEQISGEYMRRGDYVKVYVVDVHKSSRGPVIKLSRTHRNLLRRLMEQEIPEIRDGIVEIKSIAREPGARSKAAVVATAPGVDPVGSCVGMRGLRIQNIVTELGNEKIDVVEWSPDVYSYISNALSPAKVAHVLLDDKNAIKTATVVVPDRQLSLAIGKEGQNARLAAKLTGWRIDIKSESEAIAEGLDKQFPQHDGAMSTGKGGDLLAYAEQLLRKEDRTAGSDAEDRMREAARILEEMDASNRELVDPSDISLPSLEDLAQADEKSAQPPSVSFEEAAAAAREEQTFIEQFPVYDSKEEEALLNLGQADDAEEVASTTDEELPDVITADMLRSRMGQRKKIDVDSNDFEIPAELLVGLDEDELIFDEEDEEDFAAKSKTKKTKSKKATKTDKKSRTRRKRQGTFEDDDGYDGYY